jgi:murein DD-endopeptidase MepM/ murein hydrolase activator NlpD
VSPYQLTRSFQEPDDPVYYIQDGDTLSYIAGIFGVSVDSIIARNNIENPNALAVGSEIKIPGLEGFNGILEVKTIPLGENLETITKRNNLARDTLISINHITSPSEIYSGSRLIFPNIESEKQLIPVRVVEKGDTWVEMALQQTTNPWQLLNQNQITHSWQLLPGDMLFTPKDAKSVESNTFSPLIKSITIDPLPLRQGTTIQITIETLTALKFEGELAGKTLHFQPSEDQKYIALQGLNALQEPGLANFSLTGRADDGTRIDFSQFVLLEDVDFGELMVLYVDPATIDQETIDQENSTIRQVTSDVTPQKYWQGSFSFPVDEPWINAYYGQERVYNGEYGYYHTGVDFGVNTSNLNIYAPAPGVVAYAAYTPIVGNYTLIDHGWGVYSGFAHQEEIQVEVGQFVETGQLVGQIGNTGRSTGPHLHWDLWVNGVTVNAVDWIENVYP